MKMIKSFAFAIMTTIIFSVSAMATNTPVTPSSEKQQLRMELLQYIQQSNIEEAGVKAHISFMINSQSELVVLSVDTDNSNNNIARTLKSKLNYKKVKTEISKKNQIYHIDVTFTDE